MSARSKRPYKKNPQASRISIKNQLQSAPNLLELRIASRALDSAFARHMSKNTFNKCCHIYNQKIEELSHG